MFFLVQHTELLTMRKSLVVSAFLGMLSNSAFGQVLPPGELDRPVLR